MVASLILLEYVGSQDSIKKGKDDYSRGSLDVFIESSKAQFKWYGTLSLILVGLISWFITNLYAIIILDILAIYVARKVGVYFSDKKYNEMANKLKKEAKSQGKYEAMGVHSAEIYHQMERDGKI